MKKDEFFDSTLPLYPPGSFLKDASGPVTIPMTNDYLFRALLQSNNLVLKCLISSLLHLPLSAIVSVEITNPIELGNAYDEKDFYLDVKVCLNNHTIINLEMQVINEHNWPERSLSYLCRSFDHICKGATYMDVMPVIQIGLLDFTLFPDNPEFYATYKMLNIKNHSIYSDKFRLSVLDLTRIDLATEEDKLYGIDHWANLFKSTTWEEIKMLAENNEYIKTASDTIYQITQEDRIRMQCEAREDYYRRQRSVQIQMDRAQKAAAEAKERLAAAEERIAVAKTKAEAAEKQAEAAEERAKAAEERAKAANERADAAEAEIAAKHAEIARLKAELAAKS